MARRGWTCQRVSGGLRCQYFNPPRTRKCGGCEKARPAKRGPAHKIALELDYDGYITLNGGEFCGVCKRLPTANRRLDRDHDHLTAKPRGLLCARCNRQLPSWITVEWLEAAAKYLQRSLVQTSSISTAADNTSSA